MALPLLKLIEFSGPGGGPMDVVLFQVLQSAGGGRHEIFHMHLTRNERINRNEFIFDNQTFRGFENPEQFRIVVQDDHGHDRGETIIDAGDVNSPDDELFIKMFGNGVIGGPFYQLGYKVLRGV
jgi:hypothetical protein